MNTTTLTKRCHRVIWTIGGFVFIITIGIVDFLTGYEIGFSLFYLLPITLVVWRAGKWPGMIASLFGAVIWLAADYFAGQTYTHPGIYYWNTSIRLGFFFTITILMSALGKYIERERVMARTDFLTGAINSRYFYDLLNAEINRYQRYRRPFSLAYLDIDNFKTINDLFGHFTGDQVLTAVVANIQGQLRRADIVARLGGDEFALLLPETDSQAAIGVLSRIQTVLSDEMQRNGWEVTFSIGVITCLGEINDAEDLINRVDGLMYSAKKQTKNAVNYAIYPD